MGSAVWRLRAGVFVLVGAVAVHELRYLLAGQQQDGHAHEYMGWLVPAACALLVLALVEFAVRLFARPGRATPLLGQAGVRWLALSSLLVTIFAVQETAELLLAHGRLDVADALVAHGSWLATPLAFGAGAVIALLLRGAEVLLSRAYGREPRARAVAPARPFHLSERRGPRIRVVGCHLAGRAPPSFAS